MLDDIDRQILDLLHGGPASSTRVGKCLGLSRQAAHARLKRLVEQALVVSQGAARSTRYTIPKGPRWEQVFEIVGLAEDQVLKVVQREAPGVGRLLGAAMDVVSYAITELLNNAIDHSAGRHVHLAVEQAGAVLHVDIADDGVGAFAHVARHLDLAGELEAIQELSKGKTTTAPERHTGEGLFFVSKAVDRFRLESGTYAWIVDNVVEDVAVGRIARPRTGTLAHVEVDATQARELVAVFNEYTDNYEFTKTRTMIRLFEIGTRFISRSEAKRLLTGLERFREVVLDFRGVQTVGQGFADEVFRVWARAHPEVSLVPVHMNDAVAFMLRRAGARVD